jgi:hypothetical protein
MQLSMQAFVREPVGQHPFGTGGRVRLTDASSLPFYFNGMSSGARTE